MSIEMENPQTSLELADASGNLIEQIRLAHHMGDKVRMFEAINRASGLSFQLVQKLSEEAMTPYDAKDDGLTGPLVSRIETLKASHTRLIEALESLFHEDGGISGLSTRNPVTQAAREALEEAKKL